MQTSDLYPSSFGERHLIYSFADSLNNIGTEKKK